jgi:hypothetical protein
VGHHHADGLGVIHNGNFYARYIEFFLLVSHRLPQLLSSPVMHITTKFAGTVFASGAGTGKEKLDISGETDLFPQRADQLCE